MTRAKVCGVTTAADRDAAVAAGADAGGVVVDVPVETPRAVSVERAATIVQGTPPFVSTVLVTMPEAGQDAVALQRRVAADAIQVHDRLPPAIVGGLGERTTADVIAVTAVDDPEATAYADHADALLVDALDPAGGGGTGETTDWGRARALVGEVDVPVVLAGGLTPANVTEAIETVRPYAVDVASGVEREGGRKDHDAVAAFVDRAHGAGAPA